MAEPVLAFPESLPVSALREQIMQAMTRHQVIIVCGETGSGKTTQLPKMALALGRGRRASALAGWGPAPCPPGQGRLIGHTQPRRIAASSVARRIAEELQTPLGEVVGFKVRFQDRLSRGASVKLMTDGILLAETQTDPLLAAYDTLIIDEAHERSLNIDFLLGYLRQILPRRPDLRVVVTSATIDAQRFADHFASRQGPAPVIMVSGRTYPVEQRYRPFEETREFDLNDAICAAVDELWLGGGAGRSAGDILVFLPGEREIREAADALRRHLAPQPVLRHAEVIPLFARLSQAEQDRVFEAHTGRRIVLATNVAETSLTVPGIRYVIDAGTARVKRYSFRSKVEQLLVEPISQAAANQRAGRCGRVADGVCIRLYAQQDFDQRARFTDPEILRSSLAGVILRMKSLRLGAVEEFPFIERPPARAIADGYQLLAELGAVDDARELTAIGAALARLPLDPRVGRMILEARERQALDEVLVVAAALSVQDVRDRPLDAQAAADAAHQKFDDERSEFTGYLKLWRWLAHARGDRTQARSRQISRGDTKASGGGAVALQRVAKAAGGGAAAPGEGGAEHRLSNRQYEQLLRQNFIHVRRVREWKDIHSQLHTVVAEHQWRLNTVPATYEQLHLSMLCGLLGNVGCKLDDEDAWLGARGIKFHRHPGAHLSRKPGRWILAAELVETTRLFGRGIAAIEPQWIEQVAGHLLKKQLLDPHWEKKSARVCALERATLYGIVVYNGRRVDFGRIDPQGAREIFIRQALVEGQWESTLPFLAANRKLVAQVQELEHKSRRQDVLVDDELIYAFYDQHLPPDVCSGHACEQWYRQAVRAAPGLLQLTRAELMRHEAAGITTQAFPRSVRLGGVDCVAEYLHEPGDPRDGLTVTVPLFVLNQVNEERCEWLVPGMLKDKILALLKSLHQKPRSRFVPLPDSAARIAAQFSAPEVFGAGSLVDALLHLVRETTSLDVRRGDFKLDALSPHHFMHFRVTDDNGRQLGVGRNLAALKAELGGQARGAFQALAALRLARPQPVPAAALAPAPGSGAGGRTAVARPATAGTGSKVAGAGAGAGAGADSAAAESGDPGASERYRSWTFGTLPELLEIRRKGQTLIGFPALVDGGDAVTIEVFDEPQLAAQRHRVGLRRLVALQLREALKYLEKNIPGLQAMAAAYMPLGTLEQLRAQVVEIALDRAFLADPLPADAGSFALRIEQGRGRLTLIANEVARLAAGILAEYALAVRKIKDSRQAADAAADAQQQLQRLMPPDFLVRTPWSQLQHFTRYLKAIVLRLDKLRADPARDKARLAEIRPQEARLWREVAERKGVADARLQEFRWLLEELRVSLFAQELRTPQPVSVKRLDKAWAQIHA